MSPASFGANENAKLELWLVGLAGPLVIVGAGGVAAAAAPGRNRDSSRATAATVFARGETLFLMAVRCHSG